jgi:serpin B
MVSLLPEFPIDENVVCSPLSVRIALAMLLVGAGGETREQLEDFIGAGDSADFAALFDGLQGNGKGATRLSIANGAFLQPDFPVLRAYRETIESTFRAQMENLDFTAADAAAAHINEWVGKATEGMITNLVSPEVVSQLTRLILINAVYFCAEWKNPFEERCTRPEPFHPLEGATYDVPMMRQTDTLPYAVDDVLGFEAVRIPYRKTSLVVVLPRPGRFREVARLFREDHLAVLRFFRREIALRLPRFEQESRLSLGDVLSSLGLRLPFDPKHADFSALTDHPAGLFVEAIEQAARIRVDEQGTEAAAATAATTFVRGLAIGDPDRLQFHVDRPFLFFVTGDDDDRVLFAGRCTAPKGVGRKTRETGLPHEGTQENARRIRTTNRKTGRGARRSAWSRLRDLLAGLLPGSRQKHTSSRSAKPRTSKRTR